MEVCCSICGQKQEITKVHKDFQKFRQKVDMAFVCDACSNKVKFQAREKQKERKPL